MELADASSNTHSSDISIASPRKYPRALYWLAFASLVLAALDDLAYLLMIKADNDMATWEFQIGRNLFLPIFWLTVALGIVHLFWIRRAPAAVIGFSCVLVILLLPVFNLALIFTVWSFNGFAP